MGRRAPLVLLLIAAAAYLWRLNDAPIYLASDEVIIANDAWSIAQSGRTHDGVFLPLYVYVPLSASWFMPFIYYWMALWLKVLPLAEWSIRLPTAIIGLAGIVLAYRVARLLAGDRVFALVAAAMLACAPAYFILSRYALDYIYPVPFILGWLLCLLKGLESARSRRWLFGAGLCLGAGFYSYIASMALMPMYAVLTLMALWASRRSSRDLSAFALGAVIPLLLFAAWFVQHPDVVHSTAERYGLAGTAVKTAPVNLAAIADRYWRFFHPDFLFLTGDTYLPFSTRSAGVFPLVSALLIAVGVFAAVGPARSPMTLLILAGFVLTPVPAAILEDPGAIRRAMGMVPFGALLAALGAVQLSRVARVPFFKPLAWTAGLIGAAAGLGFLVIVAVQQSRLTPTGLKVAALSLVIVALAAAADRARHGRLLTGAALAAIVVQFMTLQVEYHGEYRVRAGVWLNGNMRGAMLRLIEEHDRRPDSKIYFSTFRNGQGFWDLKNRWLPAYWQFYLLREHREALASETVFMSQNDPIDAIPKGSIVLGNIEAPNLRSLLASGSQRIADIPEADRDPFMTIVIR